MWVYTEACGAPALRTGGLRRMERDTDKGQHVQRSVGKGSGGAIAQPQERAGGGGGRGFRGGPLTPTYQKNAEAGET